MKHLLFGVLCFASLAFMGCPLQTESPIIAKTGVPSWLVGRWASVRADGRAGEEYTVKIENEEESKISISPVLDTGRNTVYQGVISKVKGHILASVFDAGDDELGTSEGYYHYEIERGYGDISVIPLKENIVSYQTTGVDLAEYIRKAGTSEDFLDRGAQQHFVKRR